MEPPIREGRRRAHPRRRAGPVNGADRLPTIGRTVVAVGRRPSLWATTVRQVAVLAAPGWWRRAPFLPRPAPEYLRFRLQTAYGGAGQGPIEPDDLVSYLEWCRATRRHLRQERRAAGRPGSSGRRWGPPFRHRQSPAGRVAAPVP